jgi:hypothetical protein
MKKFPSLRNELLQLEDDLQRNPKMGSPIGHNSYKIRLSVRSKGKGKSGGLRAISHLESDIIGLIDNENGNIVVNLISIYDKSETASISDNELQTLIAISN